MDFGFHSIIKLHTNVHMVIVVFIYDDIRKIARYNLDIRFSYMTF